jgi:small subunit ribosomal protein S16
MLAIKLQRVGKKHQPSYRVVVAMKRSKMAGPPVEDLGSYNPFTKIATVKKERASYWLGVGAQPTVTAHNLLVKEGIVTKSKLAVKMAKPVAPVAEAAPVADAAPAVDPVSETPAEVSPVAEPAVEAETSKETPAA